jgi:glutamate/tyrosine decarboxylase-like PLP-dependent enzyme
VSEPDTGGAHEGELQAFRRAAHALVDGVADHLAALPSRPVWQPLPDALREQLLDLPLPERATTLDELVATALSETSIVAFRARPADCPPSRLEDVNRALPEAVQARGRAFVTGTVFDGRETLRACILHPGTGSEQLATLAAEVVATARTLAA